MFKKIIKMKNNIFDILNESRIFVKLIDNIIGEIYEIFIISLLLGFLMNSVKYYSFSCRI